ncbi:hypothetical protein CMT52_15935 [Elizabethkingia anophelis]|nr:YqaJ viral recombinase family protein [Elizabethkingia anophelis]MCT4034861.1 YqaJ viral recombinase family protein [Elizabethkingia anophelis]MCT4085498.1 YqaJ viral recombinase family protein [Elizabethkingia anophelis]MCT4156946.1 YqaJ viral recombinase family protein [Elizabethkingia anophelis]MCT4171267.1 YqaJ viral recombinase family protein [Elizabethkingia anophelis]
MLTKNSIKGLNLEAIRAEHESALASMEKVSEAEKKREAWLKSRLGKFSSSDLGKLMTYEDKLNELPQGAKTYITEKVLEILTDGKSTKNFTNDSMDRGNEKEIEAIEKFEEKKNLKCYATGEDQKFIELCSYFGGTPDGLIDNDSLVEVKCPDSKTHFFRLKNIKNQHDFKKYEKDYYWQIQGNLLASGRTKAYFIDYDDRFTNESQRLLIIEIERNDLDIDKIKKRLQLSEAYKKQLLAD